jgi:hypothetical protein
MKKIYLAICVAALMLVSACSKEFVSPRHNSSEPLEDYFNTEARMFQSLVAAYDPLEWFDYAFGQYDALHLVNDIMADDMYCGGSNDGDQPILVKTHYYTLTPTEQPNQIWTVCYSGINRANTVIQYVDGVEEMSEANKTLYKAEATTLRSLYYCLLWKYWGNIPYYEENLKSPYFCEQIDHDAVYANVIKNLEDVIALNVLPMKAATGNEGRVTKAMVYMLYAEMVMYQKDQGRYATALGYMKEIISSGQYALVDDFAGIWLESGEWGSESIWEINYISEGGVRSWGNSIAIGGEVYSVLCGIPAEKGTEFQEGWGFGTIAKSAYDMYDDTDIRRDGGILNFEKYATEHPGASYTPRWQDTGYFNLKYLPYKGGNHGYLADDNLNYGNNFRYYRYAETLLNAAELSNLLGQDGTSYLKQVRDRAHSQDTGTTYDDIIEERHKEFVGEGKRYWDLVRSGQAASVLTASKHEYRPNNWSESKKYWPIPQSEIDKDPALQQNNY